MLLLSPLLLLGGGGGGGLGSVLGGNVLCWVGSVGVGVGVGVGVSCDCVMCGCILLGFYSNLYKLASSSYPGSALGATWNGASNGFSKIIYLKKK